MPDPDVHLEGAQCWLVKTYLLEPDAYRW